MRSYYIGINRKYLITLFFYYEKSYSVKVVLRTDKVLKNGDCPLILSVIINSKQKKINLKEKINPKFWDKKMRKQSGKDLNCSTINWIKQNPI